MLFSPEIFTTFMSLSSSNIPMVTKSKALALTSLNAVASSDVRYSTPIPSGFTRPDFRFLVGGCPISSLGYPSMSSLIRARNSSVPLVYFVIEYPRKESFQKGQLPTRREKNTTAHKFLWFPCLIFNLFYRFHRSCKFRST